MWEDILKALKRYALSRNETLRDMYSLPKVDKKPRGIWYGFTLNYKPRAETKVGENQTDVKMHRGELHSWIDIVADRGSYHAKQNIQDYNFIHILDVRGANIIEIKTLQEAKEFFEKYKSLPEDYNHKNKEAQEAVRSSISSGWYINWSKVKNDYDGIEFRNVKNLTPQVKKFWKGYEGIDLDSGCIWTVSGIDYKTIPLTDRHYKRYERRD